MQWIVPIAIWSNDIILLFGAIFTKEILHLKAVVYAIILIDVVATIYWRVHNERKKAKILDTVMYVDGGILTIEGRRKDLEVILSSAKDVVSKHRGDVIKIKLRR